MNKRTQKRKILIVEDDSSIREVLGALLHAEGYEAVSAGNGQEALDLLAQQSLCPDLILLDLMMPVMDGWEFLRRKACLPTINAMPVVALSAAYGIYSIEHASMFLPKPIELEKLLSAIERLCAPAK